MTASRAAPGRTSPRAALCAAGALAFVAALALVLGGDVSPASAQEAPSRAATSGGGCLVCHTGIEDAHPWSSVTCVQCHGGDAAAAKKEDAHVRQAAKLPGDERVLGQNWDTDWSRFVDPGNLRAAAAACGPCHSKAVSDTLHSLHASTSGHLADGLYENGATGEKHSPVSVFPVRDSEAEGAPRPTGAVPALKQVPPFASGGPRGEVSTHFTDLPRKACMQCHLWSRGRAVRGRAGMDGDYRGEGCSACHMPYADEGTSASRDPTIDKFEPGHPREHRMVRFPTTDACARCHYGDASIGLSFRGLAQPVPGMPQTPDAPGLHRKRLNGVYYIDDPAATPPDVHHARGMHCIDCHTRHDVMGDGSLYRRMEDAVEIQCETCHGTQDDYATGVTRRGSKLAHLVQNADGHFLKSRVTGKLHRVKQSRDVVKPGSKDYNASAAVAMNADHGRLACYACHSGWNPNFFGFHFDRNEQFTQLDLLSGQRTPGRVTTQEKVFSTFKNFYVGWDSHGRLAPYMVGFSSMATVHGKDGETVLDQELPVTRAGLSGMTMIHHQTHTTTARARQCVECHRSPTALGRGSVNFRLAREFAAVAAETGAYLVAVDRKTPANSAAVSFLAIPGTRAVALVNDKLTGRAQWLFAASTSEGLVVADASNPGFPRIVFRTKTACTDPQALLVAASRLYIADGEGGLRVFDIASPGQPKQRAALPGPAYGLHLDGTNLYVAAGKKGLAVVDVRSADAPRFVVESFDVNAEDTAPIDARAVSVMFQFSRPHPDLPEGPRSRARNLASVASLYGIHLLDVTDPSAPKVIRASPFRTNGEGDNRVVDTALATIYELGSEGGAIASRERDLLFLASGNAIAAFDVTDPENMEGVGATPVGGGTRSMRVARMYNPPFVQTYVLTVGAEGMRIVDVSRPAKPGAPVAVAGVPGSFDIDLEEFPLDRAVDADGKPLLDVSHEGARWMTQDEFQRVIGAPLLVPGGAR